jgi:hypothetical protein
MLSRPFTLSRRRVFATGAALSTGALMTGCVRDAGPARSTAGLVAWPAEDIWPMEVDRAPAEVQEAYKYAVDNYETLQWMPCFCGCVSDGHRHNFDCYVREVRDDGSFALDAMSFG